MADGGEIVVGPPSVPRLSYDPTKLLKELQDYQLEAFEECFPRNKFDDISRHRALVSGNLELEFDSPSPSDRDSSYLSRYQRDSRLRDRSSNYISTPTLGRQLQGIFFLSENGERTIYGSGEPLLQPFADDDLVLIFTQDINAWYNNFKQAKLWVDDRGRHHLIRNRGRAFADRIIHYSYRQSHPSEKGWKLPRDHRCHFLNWPREIREQVLGYLLIAAAPITPEVIVCSWKRHLLLPGYCIEGTGHGLNVNPIRIPRNDEHGPYVEIRTVLTKPIDATCLRVNRQLNVEGSKLLYGRNHFNCALIPDYVKICTGVYTMDDNGSPSFHRMWKWNYQTIGNPDFMRAVKDLWKYRKSETRVPGFIYCDPFLRFLYTIGPQNSANLRSISLGGEMGEVHYLSAMKCDERCKWGCIAYNLRLYEHFVRDYCPNLQKLALQGPSIGDEWLEEDDLITAIGRVPKRRHTYENCLPMLLKSDIWRFPALRDISVNYKVYLRGKMPVPTLEKIREEVKSIGVLGYKPAEEEAPVASGTTTVTAKDKARSRRQQRSRIVKKAASQRSR